MSRLLFAICSRLLETARGSKGSADAELLSRFVQSGDSAAFELLVWRHGPLVWSVCRRILGPSADAEDAFQATFVVLTRKASTIGNGPAFVGWLHRVAWRTALKVRKTRARQIRREQPLATGYDVPQDDDPSHRLESAEQNAILDRELARLPEKYRLPLILCDLESRTHEAAAAELKLPLGTLNSRLARGRDLLRRRLLRNGVAFAGLGAVSTLPTIVSAKLPDLLRAPSLAIGHLADSTIRSMAVAAIGKVIGTSALCGILIAGVSMMTLGAVDGPANPPAKEPAKNLSVAAAEKQATAARFIDPDAGPLPEGAVARIGSTRLRHAGDVTGLKYSPDGKWLASVSTSPSDATARLWNSATGKQQMVVNIKADGEVSERACGSVGFAADSKTYFVIDSASFRAFDILNGNELFAHAVGNPVRGGPGLAAGRMRAGMAAGIAPDGKTYVLTKEGSVQSRILSWELCDVTTGQILQRAEPSEEHNGYRNEAVEFSSDSRYFLVGKSVIEAATGKVISRIKEGVRFVPCTDWLVGANSLFDFKTGKQLRKLEAAGRGSIAVSPDGKSFVAGNIQNSSSQIIDIATGKEIARIPATTSIDRLAFSPDGKLLAGAGFFCGAITVWDMTTYDYAAIAAIPPGFYGAHFVGDSNTLAIPERGDPLVDWRTGRILERLADVNDVQSLFRAALSPDRKWYARWEPNDGKAWDPAKDSSIALLDAKTGVEIKRLKGHKGFPGSIAFSRNGSRLACAGESENTIRVWDLRTGSEIAQFAEPELVGRGQKHVSLSEDGRIMAVNEIRGNIIFVWNVDAKTRLARIEPPASDFSHVVVSPDGKWVAGGAGRQVHVVKAGGRSATGRTVTETSVQIWEVSTGREVHSLPGHSNIYPAEATCGFSPDSRWLTTGDAMGRLRLWEVITGQEIHSFVGHRSHVSANFSPDARLLVAASEEAPCLIWDVIGAGANAKPASMAELKACWKELGEADAKKAFRAICRVAANPGPSVELVRNNLKPATIVSPKKLLELFRDLASDRFKEREAATAELSRLADQIEPALRKRRISTDSADERARLESILKTLETPTPKRIHEGRALTALELIGTPEASKLLSDLAAGAKDDLLTQAAEASCIRLRKRSTK